MRVFVKVGESSENESWLGKASLCSHAWYELARENPGAESLTLKQDGQEIKLNLVWDASENCSKLLYILSENQEVGISFSDEGEYSGFVFTNKNVDKHMDIFHRNDDLQVVIGESQSGRQPASVDALIACFQQNVAPSLGDYDFGKAFDIIHGNTQSSSQKRDTFQVPHQQAFSMEIPRKIIRKQKGIHKQRRGRR